MVLAPGCDADEAPVVQGVGEPAGAKLEPVGAAVGQEDPIDLDDLRVGHHRAVGDAIPEVVCAGVVVQQIVADGGNGLEGHTGEESAIRSGLVGQRGAERRSGGVLLEEFAVDELETVAQIDLEHALLERLAQVGDGRLGRSFTRTGLRRRGGARADQQREQDRRTDQ